MARTDLGKWMITDGGEYNAQTTYEKLTGVLYNGSTYLTLKTVSGVQPSDDGVNYRLMAKGFPANGASQDLITDAFSTSKAYAVGDYCIYLNRLYKFTAAKAAGAWDGSKVVPVTIASELASLNSTTTTVQTGSLISTSSEIDVSDSVVYKIGRIVFLSLSVQSSTAIDSVTNQIYLPEIFRPITWYRFPTSIRNGAYGGITIEGNSGGGSVNIAIDSPRTALVSRTMCVFLTP